MGEEDQPPGLEADEDERIDYLSVLAAMAFASGEPAEAAVDQLRELCAALEVSEFGAEVVVAAAQAPEQVRLDEVVTRLRESELRFALFTDAVFIAQADAAAGPDHGADLDALAKALEVSPTQNQLIRKYVAAQRPAVKGGNGHNPAARKRAEIGAGLEGAGVPLAAVGLSAVLGGPLGAGVSLAAWLGLASFAAVRWLQGRLGG